MPNNVVEDPNSIGYHTVINLVQLHLEKHHHVTFEFLTEPKALSWFVGSEHILYWNCMCKETENAEILSKPKQFPREVVTNVLMQRTLIEAWCMCSEAFSSTSRFLHYVKILKRYFSCFPL